MAPPRLKNEVICQRSGHSLHPVKQNTAICDVCQEENDIRITKPDGSFGDPNPKLKIHHEKHKAVAGAATSITEVPTSIVEASNSIVMATTSLFIVLVAFVLVAVVAFFVVQHSALSDYGRGSVPPPLIGRETNALLHSLQPLLTVVIQHSALSGIANVQPDPSTPNQQQQRLPPAVVTLFSSSGYSQPSTIMSTATASDCSALAETSPIVEIFSLIDVQVVTCANAPCLNGANCTDNEPSSSLSDLMQLQTSANYTCHCPFGYEGVNCELLIDYCLLLHPCRNGAFCTHVFFEPGYICECAEGYNGDHCEIDVNECAQRPCLNGGLCIDGINNFTCDCSNTGYEGYLCEVYVTECRRLEPCVRGHCVNSPGNYSCICESDDDCGRHCDQKDPCKTPISPFTNETVCYNGATCTAFCDDLDTLMSPPQPKFTCSCTEGFEGPNCSLVSPSDLDPNLKLVAVILLIMAAIVGIVVLVKRTKKKPGTDNNGVCNDRQAYEVRSGAQENNNVQVSSDAALHVVETCMTGPLTHRASLKEGDQNEEENEDKDMDDLLKGVSPVGVVPGLCPFSESPNMDESKCSPPLNSTLKVFQLETSKWW